MIYGGPKKMTKNFSVHEFNSKDGTPVPEELFPNLETLAKNLQVIRDHIGEPLQILSGYRSPAHNKKVGGKKASYHMKAMAADLTCKSLTPRKLHTLILTLIKQGKVKNGGLGLYPGFVHYDIGPANRRW
jgi:uncharacterized protein YcbK (DUF882 family)